MSASLSSARTVADLIIDYGGPASMIEIEAQPPVVGLSMDPDPRTAEWIFASSGRAE